MKRVKLVVAYDGTNYSGWQIQPNALTIEEVLNRELSALLQEEIKVIGASRTDAGVHALGNVAVFDTESRIPGEKFSYALNQRLPEDIVIQNSCEVAADFHPRHCDTRKTYEYKICNRSFPLPLQRFDTYFFHYPLDVARMQRAAQDLVGAHDFKSFCSVKAQVETTVRHIYSVDVFQVPDTEIITIRIRGNGFLYNMVRIIAGTLIQIGNGNLAENVISGMLAAKNREAAGPTAPPQGLTLMGIEYCE